MSLMSWSGRLAAFGGVLFLSTSAVAQRSGEVVFFSDIGFRGRSFTLNGARPDLRLGWTVRSARSPAGEAWEVCSRANYQGQCNRLDGAVGNVGWTAASARPVRGGVAGDNRSLRGMSAEFFPTPSNRSGRVESCRAGTAACTADSAQRFCRGQGWTTSAHQRQETVRGRNFLADVLCTRG